MKYECPTCGSVIEVEHRDQAPDRPFCSRRCKLVDLGKWLDGSYRTSEPSDQSDLKPTVTDAEETSDDSRDPPGLG